MLRSVADKAIEIQHDGFQHFRWRRLLIGEQHNHQTRFPVLFAVFVFRLGDAIGEDDQPIAALQRDLSRFVDSVLLDAERNAARWPALDGSCLAAQDGRVVSGVDVGQAARCRAVLGDECGGEPAAILAIAAGLVVHAAYQVSQRTRDAGQRLQAGLVGGHQHGSGHALASYIGDGDQVRAAGRI